MENMYFSLPSWKTRIFWVLCHFKNLGLGASGDFVCLQVNGRTGEDTTAGFFLGLQHYNHLVSWLIRKKEGKFQDWGRGENHIRRFQVQRKKKKDCIPRYSVTCERVSQICRAHASLVHSFLVRLLDSLLFLSQGVSHIAGWELQMSFLGTFSLVGRARGTL